MDDPLIEHMAEGIHLAWMAEKHRQGYADHVYHGVYQGDGGRQLTICTHCPPGQHQGTDKHHPDMLPYADLADNVKAYDRVTARAALTAVMQAGYRLVRVAP